MTTALAVNEHERLQITPIQLLQLAVDKGADIDTIERLARLQSDMLDREAKVGFEQAMHRCQSQMTRIGADLTNPQTKSRYASFAQLDRHLRPIYAKEGLSLSFDTGDAPGPDLIRVLCHVSHQMGHTRTYRIDMPADGKGAKGGDVMTKTHATGAAASYGSRYLLKMIFNVAVGEDDDDGNLGGNMAEQRQVELADMLKDAPGIPELMRVWDVAKKEILESKDHKAMAYLTQTKDDAKRKLQEAR